MRYIDVTGKTESEAIEKALAQLGLDRDDVSVEILERAKSGFLGIGACPAKVRVTYEEVEETPAAAVVEEPAPVKEEIKAAPKAEKTERPRNEKKNRGEKKAPKAEKKPEMSKTAAPVDMGEEANDAKAEQIRTFLTGLMEHMESTAQVKVYLWKRIATRSIWKVTSWAS